MVKSLKAVSQTKSWIEKFVVGLNICPFAGHPFQSNQIAFRVYDEKDLEEALHQLALALEELNQTPSEKIETTLFILPNMLNDFLEYWEFFGLAESLLIDLKFEGIIQLASFHPNYIFAESEQEDKANYTNRSPFAMIHLLKEDSVHQAIETHPDVESIPVNNIQLLRSMKEPDIKKLSSH